MRSTNDGTRALLDEMTASQYLALTLDEQWQNDTEYLGNREDMTRSWELQNEIRRTNGLTELGPEDLLEACEHFARRGD